MGEAVSETGTGISCLISDAFLSFSGELAEEMRVPWILVWISMPYPLYVYTNIRLIRQICSNSPPTVPDGHDGRARKVIPDVPEVLVGDLPEGVLAPGDLESDLVGILGNLGALLPRASAIAMNFYHELDPTALTNNLRNTLPNLLYLGFLTLSLPPPPKPESPPLDSDINRHCMSWLERQKPRSVAYIGFGTLAILPENELHALAAALEESNVPYIWSLQDNLKEKLPSQFLQRIGARGIVVSWAPQIEVLAHSSTGVFVTHCGSNSVYESVANGVPMICRPFFGDHRMNGRIVEEVWEIGVRVEGGVITKDGVLKSLRLLLVDQAGKAMREKVRALKKLVQVAAGPSGRAAEDFRSLLKIVS
ncbi:anthocyanidin 3-O-glucosyltransferase 7-like [Rhodamnia argentea]|uniref:Anthocyanidin 3-O-glucosyltransferase 7-like n=1 Tax=Rhodamnia argentea TaxID=178133 RepID=A0A8B8PY51_9MYRT|nr:anthocyanidin 3-O-glucosyltransferase 7-like [Rhodamnia argentea]